MAIESATPDLKKIVEGAADFLPLLGTDYVELYVGNAKQAAHFYKTAFGFQSMAYAGLETGVKDRTSYVLVQDKIRLVLRSSGEVQGGRGRPIGDPQFDYIDLAGPADVDAAFGHARAWVQFNRGDHFNDDIWQDMHDTGHAIARSLAGNKPLIYREDLRGSRDYTINAVKRQQGVGTTFHGQAVNPGAVVIKYTYEGDVNLDGSVNVADLGILASNWQRSGNWSRGDFNYDGTVDTIDFNILAANFGATAPATGALVPEPAAVGALVLLCLLPTRRVRSAR